MESWIIFGLLMLGFFIGGVVSIPCKMYIVSSYERKGNIVNHNEKIFMKKKRAIKEYRKQREEAIASYVKEFPDDFRIPEDTYLITKGRNVLYDSEGERIEVSAKFIINAPYMDYDTKELVIELQHKSLS